MGKQLIQIGSIQATETFVAAVRLLANRDVPSSQLEQ